MSKYLCSIFCGAFFAISVISCKTANSAGSGGAANLESKGDVETVKLDFSSSSKKSLAGRLFKMLSKNNDDEAVDEDSGAMGGDTNLSISAGKENLSCEKSGKYKCSIKVKAVKNSDKKFETKWNDQKNQEDNFPYTLWEAMSLKNGNNKSKQLIEGDDGNWIECHLDKGRTTRCYFKID